MDREEIRGFVPPNAPMYEDLNKAHVIDEKKRENRPLTYDDMKWMSEHELRGQEGNLERTLYPPQKVQEDNTASYGQEYKELVRDQMGLVGRVAGAMDFEGQAFAKNPVTGETEIETRVGSVSRLPEHLAQRTNDLVEDYIDALEGKRSESISLEYFLPTVMKALQRELGRGSLPKERLESVSSAVVEVILDTSVQQAFERNDLQSAGDSLKRMTESGIMTKGLRGKVSGKISALVGQHLSQFIANGDLGGASNVLLDIKIFDVVPEARRRERIRNRYVKPLIVERIGNFSRSRVFSRALGEMEKAANLALLTQEEFVAEREKLKDSIRDGVLWEIFGTEYGFSNTGTYLYFARGNGLLTEDEAEDIKREAGIMFVESMEGIASGHYAVQLLPLSYQVHIDAAFRSGCITKEQHNHLTNLFEGRRSRKMYFHAYEGDGATEKIV